MGAQCAKAWRDAYCHRTLPGPNITSSLARPWRRRFHPGPWTKKVAVKAWPRPQWPARCWHQLASPGLGTRSQMRTNMECIPIGRSSPGSIAPDNFVRSTYHTCNCCRGQDQIGWRCHALPAEGRKKGRAPCISAGFHIPYGKAALIWGYILSFLFHS